MTVEQTIAAKLVHIEKLTASGPQLSGSERGEYKRICKRVDRASADLRRAQKRGDTQKAVSAQRALANAQAQRAEFLSPKIDHLWAPARIVAKFEHRWSGPGVSGLHVHEVEMVLDYKDLSGPQYRTVRVLKDEGAPFTNARTPPNAMGVAWFAIGEQIERGKIVVLDEEVQS